MDIILQYLGYFFTTVGAVFLFLGALGIFRMPDFYTRIQAGTKASTLGAMSLLLGVAFLEPDWWIKLFIITIFVGISNPLSSHAIARASHKHKIKPLSPEKIDALKEDTEKQKEEKA